MLNKSTVFLIILITFGCTQIPESKKVFTKKDVQGNWECHYVDKYGDTSLLTLHFNNQVCQFLDQGCSDNNFSITNNILVIKSETGDKERLKIINVDGSKMEISSIRGWLNEYYEISQTETLTFFKVKRENDFLVNRISFFSDGSGGVSPSFKLEMNESNLIKFEGYSTVKEGSYTGQSPHFFYQVLLDKVHYLDFKNWKKKYRGRYANHQTCFMVFETNHGIYTVLVDDDENQPNALRSIVDYVFSNYESFQLLRSDSSAIFVHEEELNSSGVLPGKKIQYTILPSVEIDY